MDSRQLAIEDGQVLQLLGREKGCPAIHKVRSEAIANQRYQLALPPACCNMLMS